MKVAVKTSQEIAFMREGGRILAEILHELALYVKEGILTQDINLKTEALMAKHNVAPSFKGYRGYPAVICVSINEEIVHGIPGKRRIQNGDLVKLDCGVFHKGFHSDAAVAVLVGDVKPEVRSFAANVQKALEKGISAIIPGAHLGDVSFAIQQHIESHGYSVIRDFIGHGIGRSLHEAPEIHNVGAKGKGLLLVPGMTLAIEPIIAMGQRYCKTLSDDWTAVTKDSSPACQVEHTVLVTSKGAEVLTKYNNTINCIYPQ